MANGKTEKITNEKMTNEKTEKTVNGKTADAGAANEDIGNLIALLDNFAAGDTSRMKIAVSGEQEAGTSRRSYHYGRCDIGSPWASGECYDAPEADCDRKD